MEISDKWGIASDEGLPPKQSPSFCCTVVVHLHIVVSAKLVVLQVEGVEGQADEVAGGNRDVPAAVGSVRVAGGVTRTGERATRIR